MATAHSFADLIVQKQLADEIIDPAVGASA
jgi:hypothetical protein